jgi:hypothetical protein
MGVDAMAVDHDVVEDAGPRHARDRAVGGEPERDLEVAAADQGPRRVGRGIDAAGVMDMPDLAIRPGADGALDVVGDEQDEAATVAVVVTECVVVGERVGEGVGERRVAPLRATRLGRRGQGEGQRRQEDGCKETGSGHRDLHRDRDVDGWRLWPAGAAHITEIRETAQVV